METDMMWRALWRALAAKLLGLLFALVALFRLDLNDWNFYLCFAVATVLWTIGGVQLNAARRRWPT
jgi:hypothetical protein